MAKYVYIGVFAIYIVFMILIGLYFKKRATTGKGYFIGERSIGPWVTALSFVAAYFSTVLIVGGGGWGYKQGLSTVWIGVGNALVGCFLCWIVLGTRLRQFSQRLDTMTIPEFFAKRYDSHFTRIYASLIIVVFLIIYNSSVAQGMGEIFAEFIEIDYVWAVLICGAVIAFYVTIGGYLSVVWTAMIQAIIMIAALVIMTAFGLHQAGGIDAVVTKLSAIPTTADGFNMVEAPGPWGWNALIGVILTVSLGVWAMPQLMIRFYSIKSVKVLKIGTIVVTIGGAFAILAYANGSIARAIYPDNSTFLNDKDKAIIAENVEKATAVGTVLDTETATKQYMQKVKIDDRAIPYLAKNNLPNFLGAIFMAGVLAAGMSTFAAILIIVAGSIVKDLIIKGFKLELTDKRQVFLGRGLNFGITIVSMLIAMVKLKMILDLTVFAWSVIAGAFFVPLVFGIYFKWITKKAIIISMVAGSMFALVWRILKDSGENLVLHEFIVGIAVATICVVVFSLFTKKYSKEHIQSVFEDKVS